MLARHPKRLEIARQLNSTLKRKSARVLKVAKNPKKRRVRRLSLPETQTADGLLRKLSMLFRSYCAIGRNAMHPQKSVGAHTIGRWCETTTRLSTRGERAAYLRPTGRSPPCSRPIHARTSRQPREKALQVIAELLGTRDTGTALARHLFTGRNIDHILSSLPARLRRSASTAKPSRWGRGLLATAAAAGAFGLVGSVSAGPSGDTQPAAAASRDNMIRPFRILSGRTTRRAPPPHSGDKVA
jgi:hypothetical protein